MDKVELIRVIQWHASECYQQPHKHMRMGDFNKASYRKSAVEDLCLYIFGWTGTLKTAEDVTYLFKSYIHKMRKAYLENRKACHYKVAITVALDMYDVLVASSEAI